MLRMKIARNYEHRERSEGEERNKAVMDKVNERRGAGWSEWAFYLDYNSHP